MPSTKATAQLTIQMDFPPEPARVHTPLLVVVCVVSAVLIVVDATLPVLITLSVPGAKVEVSVLAAPSPVVEVILVTSS